MAYIYRIYNTHNNMNYIGSTTYDLNLRFSYHKTRANLFPTTNTSLLHSAMYFIGPNYFNIELLETCDDSIVEDREQYYIDRFNSLAPSGYNQRNAKRSNANLNKNNDKTEELKNEIIDRFVNKHQLISTIAKQLHIDHRKVKKILESENIETGSGGISTRNSYAFPVAMRNIDNHDIIIKQFKNQYDAAKYVLENLTGITGKYDNVLKSIRHACMGREGKYGKTIKSAYGYFWTKEGLSNYEKRKLLNDNELSNNSVIDEIIESPDKSKENLE